MQEAQRGGAGLSGTRHYRMLRNQGGLSSAESLLMRAVRVHPRVAQSSSCDDENKLGEAVCNGPWSLDYWTELGERPP